MIIDAHTHIFPPEIIANRAYFLKKEPAFTKIYANPNARMVDETDLLKSMNKNGIKISWILGFPWSLAENARLHNDYIAQVVNKNKDRFRGLASIYPSTKWALAEAERCLSLGFHGLGEIGFYNSDLDLKSLASLCALCAEADRPLLLHTNEPVGHYYPGKTPISLASLYALLKAHPYTKLVLAHMAGGLFFYALLKKEVTTTLFNVWIDTAAAPFLYQPQAYRLAVELLGANKVLFGSDYPLLSINRYLQEFTLPKKKLTSSSLALILGKAASQLIP